MSVSTVVVQGNLLPSQNIFSEVQSIHDTGVYYGGGSGEPETAISTCTVGELEVSLCAQACMLACRHSPSHASGR